MAKTPSLFDDFFFEEDNLMPLNSSESEGEKSNLTSEPENEYELENTASKESQIQKEEDDSYSIHASDELEIVNENEEIQTEQNEKEASIEATESEVKTQEPKRSSVISLELPKSEEEETIASHDFIVSASSSTISTIGEMDEVQTSSHSDALEVNPTIDSSTQIDADSKQENVSDEEQPELEVEAPQEVEENEHSLEEKETTTNKAEDSSPSVPFLDIEILSKPVRKEGNVIDEKEEDLQDEIVSEQTSDNNDKSEIAEKQEDALQGETDEEEEAIEALPEWELSKNYYTIGEVAKMFDVNISHIRFWTNEFKLKPRTNRKGDRLYSPEIIQELRLIHYLVKVKKHTIKGAIEKLKGQKEVVVNHLSLKDSLVTLRDFLVEVRESL